MSKITEIIASLYKNAYGLGQMDMDDRRKIPAEEFDQIALKAAQAIEPKIIAAIDPWTKVEDGLPEGDVKMDWLVARPNYASYISRNHTGDEMAIIFKVAHTPPETQYHPITAPGE